MHISTLRLASGLTLATSVVAAPQSCVTRQEDGTARAAAVKEAFQFAWNGYYKYAFPHDELRPVTNGFTNSRYFLLRKTTPYTSSSNNFLEMAGAQAQPMLSVRHW